MSSHEATTSKSISKTKSKSVNSLVHEVQDNFEFESPGPEIIIKTVRTVSPFEGERNSVKLKFDYLKSFSPSAGASYFSQNFDENGYVFDGVKIEIDDIDNNSMTNATTSQLKRCKKQVLKHYYSLLCFISNLRIFTLNLLFMKLKIGWRPFFKEDFYIMPCFWRLINVFYPVLIIFLLFYAYTYEIVTCAGRLNVAVDTEYVNPYTMSPAKTSHHLNATGPLKTTTESFLDSLLNSYSTKNFNHINKHNSSERVISSLTDEIDPAGENQRQCGHILTTYVVPSVMHFFAFIIGFIYFRVNENEQLYSLMEKVFLAVSSTMKTVNQDRVIRRLKLFIFFGGLWVVLAMSMQILQRLAFGFDQDVYQPYLLFLIIQGIALVLMNSIYLAVVINHATQCELIIFYVNELRTRLEEKSITLKDAMQQILDIRLSIGSLNSTVSKMTSLVALTFLEKFIIGAIILLMNKNTLMYTWIYRGFFCFSWFIIFAFTIIQVARLNSKCHKFKQIALSSRVYGYGSSSREELDSFILFVANSKLRGKLFGVPIQPPYLLSIVIIITFTTIVLFQSSVFTPPDSFI